MKALRYDTDPPHALRMGDAPLPALGPHDLLIRTAATALNRADLLQRRGLYPPPPGASEVLGLEAAGVVEAVGEACTRFSPGDAAMALLPGGGYAEYVGCHEGLALPVPKGLDWAQAAAIPEAFITAYQALFELGRLQPGETALISGGASGVGTAAIQLAKRQGARVVALASSPPKREACLQLGADLALDYRSPEWPAQAKAFAGKAGVSVLLDIAGASQHEAYLSCLGTDARWVLLAVMGGRFADRFDLAKLLVKRVSLIGSTLRGRPLDYRIRLVEAFGRMALPAFEQGALRPVLYRTWPWEQAQEAHDCLESGLPVGKLALRVQ
jgi:putative PIG3 family NAD(P)H quinone oxidoreductase